MWFVFAEVPYSKGIFVNLKDTSPLTSNNISINLAALSLAHKKTLLIAGRKNPGCRVPIVWQISEEDIQNQNITANWAQEIVIYNALALNQQ